MISHESLEYRYLIESVFSEQGFASNAISWQSDCERLTFGKGVCITYLQYFNLKPQTI